VPGQLARLQQALAAARQHQPDRSLDLMLLTVGANDIKFSGLVADVIVDASTERLLVGRGGDMASLAESRRILEAELPAGFARLRSAIRPLVGNDLSRVVFVSYAHPALHSGGAVCPGGQHGFDVHPAFNADPGRLQQAADFVAAHFLPRMKALAQCPDGACDAMTFVDAHQPAFAEHGFCAQADSDPEFDRACFLPDGNSFQADPAVAATDPLVCRFRARDFRPYAARARWVRTANDSYFTAMTYPEGISSAQPRDIHDATWGVLSAVYGGAIHPTAQGHAAMADAALPAARAVLGLPAPPSVTAEPLPPPEPAPADAATAR
jgi:hypothetical protein